MAQILDKKNFAQSNRDVFPSPRYPVWLESSNFYSILIILSLTAGIFLFLIANEELYVSLIVGAIGFLITFFLLLAYRKKLLKKHLDRFNSEQELQRKLKKISLKNKPQTPKKLTIEDNALVVNEIIRKSKAAQILKNLPETHLDMIEMTQEYLNRSKKELENISPASPRVGALKKSRRDVEKIHKYHLLAWASIESGKYIKIANSEMETAGRLKNAEKALEIIESAILVYPSESLLLDSNSAIKSFIAETKIKDLIKQAEDKEIEENFSDALSVYKKAAAEFDNNTDFINDSSLLEKIQISIDRLENLV